MVDIDHLWKSELKMIKSQIQGEHIVRVKQRQSSFRACPPLPPGPDNADVFPFRSDCGGDKDDMWTAAMNKLQKREAIK